MSTSPTLPTVGADHCPCRILSPGEPSSHDHLAGVLVDRDDGRRARRRDVDVAFVLPVGRADVDQVAPDDRRGVGEVVRERADLFDHVQLPHDVGVGLAGELLVGDRAVVLAVVAEALQVHAHELGAVADVVRAVADDHRGTGHALERPVVDAAGRQLLVRGLPQELAVGLAEGHDDAAVAGLLGIADQLVVRADQHDAAADDGIAVGLRSELGHPLHVLAGLDVPRRRQALHERDHVALGRAAPHRPVARGRVAGRADAGGEQGRADGDAQPGLESCSHLFAPTFTLSM